MKKFKVKYGENLKRAKAYTMTIDDDCITLERFLSAKTTVAIQDIGFVMFGDEGPDTASFSIGGGQTLVISGIDPANKQDIMQTLIDLNIKVAVT